MSRKSKVITEVILRDPIHGLPLITRRGTKEALNSAARQDARFAEAAHARWEEMKLRFPELKKFELGRQPAALAPT